MSEQYLDADTMAMVNSARNRMMRDHGIIADPNEEYAEAENGAQLRMQEQNKGLAEAAAKIRAMREAKQAEATEASRQSRKKNTIKQRVIMPETAMPSQKTIDDLPEAEHVNVLSSKGSPRKQEHAPTVPKPVTAQPKVTVAPKVQTPIQHLAEPEPEVSVVKPEPVVKPVQQTQPVIEQINEPVVNYDAFTQINNLPSGGLFYSGPIYGQSLKLIDMLLLNEVRSYNAVDIFSEIFARRIRGVDPGDIMLCDEVYLLQWLRASSFPNQNMPVSGFTCDNEDCKFVMNDMDYAVNFKNLEFTTNINPSESAKNFTDGVISVTFTDGTVCDIYPRRRYHDAKLSEWRNNYFDEHDEFPREALLIIVKTAMGIEIGGCDTLDEKIKFMSELSREDSKLLYNTIAKNDIITTVKINHTCPKCGRRVTTPYPFRLDEYISGL